MITGASTVKQTTVYQGEHYHLISATIVSRTDGDRFYVTVMKDSYKDAGAQECGTLEEMLSEYEKTVEKYKSIAGE